MIEFKMPSLGADMDEAMLVGWLVAPGDRVARGDVIAEVETDKATVDMEALDAGTLVEIVHGAGFEVPVGETIGFLDDGT